MPHIEELPSGSVRLRVRLPGGKRINRTFDYASEAEQWYADTFRAADAAPVAPVAPKPAAGPTIAEHGADWLHRWSAHCERATAKWYEQALRQIAAGELGDRPLAAVKRSDVERWVATMVATKVGPSAIEQRVKTLGMIMRDALGEHLITINPTVDVRLPRKPIPDRRVLTAEEAQRLVDACDTADQRVLVLLMLDAGLRFAEAAAVEHKHVRDGFVHVVQVVDRVAGGIRPSTKSGKGRLVEASPRLLAAVAEVPRRVGVPIVTSPDGQPVQYDNFRHRVWDKLVQRAGWRQQHGPRPRAKDLRHTFATRLSSYGVAPQDVQAAMGHANYSTTQLYVHPSPDRQARVQAALAASLPTRERTAP